LLLAVTVMAVILSLTVTLWKAIDDGLFEPERAQYGTCWTAGRTTPSTKNDIWLEIGYLSGEILSIYRDLDCDGTVDEVVGIFGKHVIYCSRDSDGDGILDTTIDVWGNMPGEVRDIAPSDPEAGPFTAEVLDDKARRFPPAYDQ